MKSAIIAAVIATVISATAATAASTGLVTGAQIKNGSIGLVDLSKSAKSSLRGQVGPMGPQGPQGPGGGFDPAKVSYVTGASVVIAPGGSATVTAFCPAGAKVTGGGFLSSVWTGDNPYGSLYSTDSGPRADGAGWQVYLYNSASAPDNARVNAYAVCAAK